MRTRSMVIVATLGLAACSDGTGSSSSDLTYYGAIKPIVDAKCVGCHNAEGIAPFSLDNPTDVIEHADEMLDAIESGIMPPWPPNDDCNDYLGDRSLSAEQKATLRAWLDSGKAKGDATKAAPALDAERVRLSRVDRELSIPLPYTPRTNAQKPDDYRCFVLPWPETETRFITGFRAQPGNAKVVHHAIAFLAQPEDVAFFQKKDADEAGAGYTCFGGSGGPGGVLADTWLGSWAPGTLGSDAPAGTGQRIEPGSAIILQVHYNVIDPNAQADQTKVQFKLDASVEREAMIQPWMNPAWRDGAMEIKAGAKDVVHSFEFDATMIPSSYNGPGGPFTIYAAGLHMHQLGVSAKATIERGTGGSACLLQIDDWNFHWQGDYALRTPLHFDRGDRLRLECHWDNSPENQAMVNGVLPLPRDVNWGEGTTDEMCLGLFYIAPD